MLVMEESKKLMEDDKAWLPYTGNGINEVSFHVMICNDIQFHVQFWFL